MNYCIHKEKDNIKIVKNIHDKYILVDFIYDENKVTYPIPIRMPRRNPNLQFDKDIEKGISSNEFIEYIEDIYKKLNKEDVFVWKQDQYDIARNKNSQAYSFLEILLEEEKVCSKCKLAKITQNPQKPIQNLRDNGYIICNVKDVCSSCNNKNSTFYWLTPIISGHTCNYETISKSLKERIFKLFNKRDSLLGVEYTSSNEIIPDHKFPEDRWDNETAHSNDSDMGDQDIKDKFQILTHQTNLQKQRFCSKCLSSGVRGYPLGIKFYYEGDEKWDQSIPTKGSAAEKGCVGCGWYDLIKWKDESNKTLEDTKNGERNTKRN